MSTISNAIENAVVSGRRTVSSADAAATAAGLSAYAQGGNAFDAALAACFMETICLPMKCGMAGDLVAIFRHQHGPWRSVVSVGPGPLALADGAMLERVGPCSVGIPGAPAGYNFLASLSMLSLSELVSPAIRAADHGVYWNRIALSYLVEAQPLLERYSARNPYMSGGRLPKIGEIRRLPGLGRLLERFAESGAQLFWGKDGERLVRAVCDKGGFLKLDDLRVDPLNVLDCSVHQLAKGATLRTTPPPTGGDRLASVLKHWQTGKEPLLEAVRQERGRAKALGRQASQDGTSVVTAADEHGNAVVVVHSNSFPQFGSCVVLDDGLILNNRPGRGFDLEAPAGANNAPAAGKVPPTTLHAWVLEQDDRLLAGATPGGVNQIPWNSQTLSHLLAGSTIGEAVCLPKWALDEKGKLTAEDGCKVDAPDIEWRASLSHRAAQQVFEIHGDGLVSAVADPRVGARALALY